MKGVAVVIIGLLKNEFGNILLMFRFTFYIQVFLMSCQYLFSKFPK